jgi:hypothetical protein
MAKVIPLPPFNTNRRSVTQRDPRDPHDDPVGRLRRDKLAYTWLTTDGLQDMHIRAGDFILVYLTDAVSPSELIMVQKREGGPEVGILELIDDEQIVLGYAHPRCRSLRLARADTRIVGRVVRIERDLIGGAADAG